MGKQRRGRSERDTVGYLTEAKMQDMAKTLNARDYEILKLLDRFRCMSSEQIYKLVPSIDGLDAFSELSTGKDRCNKRLRMLFDNHFINKYSPLLGVGEGTSKQYCWLDKVGKYILTGDISAKSKKNIPPDYLHCSAVVDMFIYFKHLNEIKPGTVRYFRNENKQTTALLIPDITIALNIDDKPRLFFIEIDRGNNKESSEVSKLRKYDDWKNGYLWKQEEWAKLIDNCPFPDMIFCVDDEMKYHKSRITRINKAVSGYNMNIIFTTFSMILEDVDYFVNCNEYIHN